MRNQYDHELRVAYWWLGLFGVLVIAAIFFSMYIQTQKQASRKDPLPKIPPITYEHSSDYIGHVSDCEMYKVKINEMNGNNEIKTYSFIMAKCPNAATSILE